MVVITLARVVVVDFSQPGPDAGIMMGMLGAIGAGLVSPELYKATMKGSVAILKISIVLALVMSIVGALAPNLAVSIVAVVFVLSPILYDFMRDVLVPYSTKRTRWDDRGIGEKLLEVVAETVLSTLIGLVIVFALTGHL